MKITKFSICGFRNLGKTSIELKPITALVSLNSYGKSNLFSALDFALSFMHSTTNIRKDMMSSISSMPLNANLDTTDFSFSIEIDYDNNGNERSASYRFSFEWARNNGNGAKLVAEELSIRDKKARSHTKLLMQRFEGNAKLRDRKMLLQYKEGIWRFRACTGLSESLLPRLHENCCQCCLQHKSIYR